MSVHKVNWFLCYGTVSPASPPLNPNAVAHYCNLNKHDTYIKQMEYEELVTLGISCSYAKLFIHLKS